MSTWFGKLQKAKKSCMIERNSRKVHYDFEDGRELVEEYDLQTNCLTRRAWRTNKELKGEDAWEIEVGDPEPKYNAEQKCMIRENSSQPFIARRITKINLEWRIRNMPYPIDVYSVTVDKGSYSLIVSTTNKKYYKKINVPDLERLAIELNQDNVKFCHKFNTLIITYKKPENFRDFEAALLQEIEKLPAKNYDDEINGCKPS